MGKMVHGRSFRGGEKKLQGVRFRVPLVLPLREVGRAVRFGG